MLDTNLNVLTSNQCTFKVNNEMFKVDPRKSFKRANAYEDIKIIKHNINNKIIGVANILLQQKNPRIFRVGLIELNVDSATIELIKILEIDNIMILKKLFYLNTIINFSYINYVDL